VKQICILMSGRSSQRLELWAYRGNVKCRWYYRWLQSGKRY